MEQVTERQAKAKTLKMAWDALDRAIKNTRKLDAMIDGASVGLDEIICFTLVKSFETVVEAFWKYLRTYLREVCRIDPAASPKAVMDQAAKQRIISDDELLILIGMVDCRNRMAHVYDAESSDEVLKKVPEYHAFLGVLIKRLIE